MKITGFVTKFAENYKNYFLYSEVSFEPTFLLLLTGKTIRHANFWNRLTPTFMIRNLIFLQEAVAKKDLKSISE